MDKSESEKEIKDKKIQELKELIPNLLPHLSEEIIEELDPAIFRAINQINKDTNGSLLGKKVGNGIKET